MSFDPAELKKIRFGILQFDLRNHQAKQLKKIAQIAEKKSDLNLDFKHIVCKHEEIEKYAVLDAEYQFLYPGQSDESADLPRETMKVLEDYDVNANTGFEYRESPPQRKCLELTTEERAARQTDKLGAR